MLNEVQLGGEAIEYIRDMVTPNVKTIRRQYLR